MSMAAWPRQCMDAASATHRLHCSNIPNHERCELREPRTANRSLKKRVSSAASMRPLLSLGRGTCGRHMWQANACACVGCARAPNHSLYHAWATH